MNKSKYEQYIDNIDEKTLNDWKSQQDKLKQFLIENDENNFDLNGLNKIAGLDISTCKNFPNLAVAGLVVCSVDSMEIIYEKNEWVEMTQPYVPGYLAFREVDHLVNLINELVNNCPDKIPEVVLVDGNGKLHSNKFGLACHLGVVIDIPTIGSGKTIFSVDGINKNTIKKISQYLSNPGEYEYLIGNSEEVLGAALKPTENSTDPIIVSVGHKISLESAIKVIQRCCFYRVPEPIRIADKKTRKLVSNYEKSVVKYHQ